jgi:hypothetical protein
VLRDACGYGGGVNESALRATQLGVALGTLAAGNACGKNWCAP